MIKIYHPSDRLFDIVKVKYFGEHYYTRRESRTSDMPRSFWYFTPDIPEARFATTRYLYVTEIDLKGFYDFRNKNLKDTVFEKFESLHDILKLLKLAYQGVIYNVGEYDIIAIFEDIKPIEIIDTYQKEE